MSRPLTVLLVDDDDALLETMALWVAADGRWVTELATTGEEALAKLDSGIDVLVLDRKLPDVSGPEVLERHRADGIDAPVVVVSAFEPDSTLPADAVDEYLVKPVSRTELLDALERVCFP